MISSHLRGSALFKYLSGNINRDIFPANIPLSTDSRDILTYIDNSQKGLVTRIGDVNQQIASYTGIIKTIPKTQRDLLTIQRKLDVNEKIYVFLLKSTYFFFRIL